MIQCSKKKKSLSQRGSQSRCLNNFLIIVMKPQLGTFCPRPRRIFTVEVYHPLFLSPAPPSPTSPDADHQVTAGEMSVCRQHTKGFLEAAKGKESTSLQQLCTWTVPEVAPKKSKLNHFILKEKHSKIQLHVANWDGYAEERMINELCFWISLNTDRARLLWYERHTSFLCGIFIEI